MRELNENESIAILIVAIGLICLATIIKGCDVKTREEKTARCKAVIEAKMDPIVINNVCEGQ